MTETQEQGDVLEGYVTRTRGAQLLGCTRGNIHYHIQKGNLPLYDVGGVNMLKIVDIDKIRQKRAEAAMRTLKRKTVGSEA